MNWKAEKMLLSLLVYGIMLMGLPVILYFDFKEWIERRS